jgi:hypothetical protein
MIPRDCFEPGTAPGRERLMKADTEEQLPIPPAVVDPMERGRGAR